MNKLSDIGCQAPACDGRLKFTVPARHTSHETGRLGPVLQTATCGSCHRPYAWYPDNPEALNPGVHPSDKRRRDPGEAA